MNIVLDYSNMMVEAVGGKTGIDPADLADLEKRTGEIHNQLMARRRNGDLPFYDLPFETESLGRIVDLADSLATRFNDLVVLGIGGSALGTSALFRALAPLHFNHLDREKRGGRPRLWVLDNVDPAGVRETLDFLQPEETCFLVISKSGTTVETMSQFLVALDWVRAAVRTDFRDHFVLITDPEKGTLRELAEKEGFSSLPVPPGVGGRFSIFTPVGLLPLAAVGIDIGALLAGARKMAESATGSSLEKNPAYLNGALQYLAYRKGLPISVMMPYSDRLRDIADWYRQLWAESLGKAHNLRGEDVFVGPTPVKALGTTDQHSQVQLYMEGPFDKTVTFIVPEDYGHEMPFVPYPGAPSLNYLEGRSMAELIRSEFQATAVALARNGRPNCTFRLSQVAPETVGALVYLFEVQTVFAGALFEVDPLDQPGVEEGKQFTYGLMGRPGYSQKLDDFTRAREELPRKILRISLNKS